MDRPVTIDLAMATDRSALTLTIFVIDGPPLAHATLNAQQLRQLVTKLVQGLAHLEGQAPPPGAKGGRRKHMPAPISQPAWRLEQLDTGEPVIAVEMFPRFWAGFSLSVSDARKLSSLLDKKLGRPARTPRQRT